MKLSDRIDAFFDRVTEVGDLMIDLAKFIFWIAFAGVFLYIFL